VGFFQPHRPFLEADEDLLDSEIEVPRNLPEGAALRMDTACLKTSIRKLDQAVGKVVNALKESGEWDRSIILFTTDHGIAFPMHKCCLRDAGTRVALMMRHPELPETHGKRIDALVSQLDVVPTLYKWIGQSKPEWCEGKSMDKLIHSQVSRIRDEVFSEVNYHAAYEPMRSIRTEKYRLVCRFLEDGGWVLSNIDDSPSKDAWMRSQPFQNGVDNWELYDLEQDPEESVNLAGNAIYAEIFRDLQRRLNDWMKATEDPLLKGHLTPPALGVINHRDSISPHEAYFEDLVS
jgi:arylsulfatase A-like enzyme